MSGFFSALDSFLVGFFVLTQISYLLGFLLEGYFFASPINWVDESRIGDLRWENLPNIVLFYPVLREPVDTMHTTMVSLTRMNYPAEKFRVVAIPNSNDLVTIDHLKDLQREFPFLELMEVPPTSDPSWDCVWESWEKNPKAYWFHKGERAGNRDLPPKKTRQLIYASYNMAKQREEDGSGSFLINYIDADSCLPPDHFLHGAVGAATFDVCQATNVAGNLNETIWSSWYAFDHMAWDGLKFAHLSANGNHPYWMLGKGLFFWSHDIVDLGGFHPWLTIEDPEVGMRFWTNGKRMGVIKTAVIEEAPESFEVGTKQRTRWVAGFFQSLATPLKDMGMPLSGRIKAWLNFAPLLNFIVNWFGLPLGVWALIVWYYGVSPLPGWTTGFAAFNIIVYLVAMVHLYINTWRRTALVLDTTRERLWYMFRVNPVFIQLHWLLWAIPVVRGFIWYLKDGGLVWEPTRKVNSMEGLIVQQGDRPSQAAVTSNGGDPVSLSS
jgi:glycosyltransferase XagB